MSAGSRWGLVAVPSVREIPEGVGRAVPAINLAVARDRKLHDLRSEEAALRRDRDKTKRLLGRLIVGLRRMIRGAYVAPDLVALGLLRCLPPLVRCLPNRN